jgi:phosphate transport system substrate-binding protein
MKGFTAITALLTASVCLASVQPVTGTGATFPYPLYARWCEEFRRSHPGIEINYQSRGSGAGIQQLAEGTVDFGASDMPLKDEQIAALKIKPLHFPTAVGGVVPAYNLPGVVDELRFTPEVLAGIFLGKITRWDDPRITGVNSGVTLPALDILVVHRADGSGTTFAWTDYLAKVSPEWKEGPGSNTSIRWPTGVGQQGNEGVAGMVKQTPGAIGYVELIYALNNRMGYGSIQNSAGRFVRATLESVTQAAAAAARNMPADFRISITNAPGRDAYPVSTFTWLLMPSHIPSLAKRAALVSFLEWVLTVGQRDCAALGYAPLPAEVVTRELQQIREIQ